MTDKDTATRYDPAAVLDLLQAECGADFDQAELVALVPAITPYLERSLLPLPVAVVRITHHYLRDGARVRRLLANPDEPEWQTVLELVYRFATHNRMYPSDIEASSWPDLDAFDDIRRKLRSYNFEGSFDSWILVTVVRRLARFWRDQQSLRMGGTGIVPRAEREAARALGSYQTGPRASQRSLDQLHDHDHPLLDLLEAAQPSVADLVETAELQRLLDHSVQAYAARRNDPTLALIWHAVINQRMKLREVAVQFGLSIAQVNRRIEHIRTHLRQDPTLLHWLNSAE